MNQRFEARATKSLVTENEVNRASFKPERFSDEMYAKGLDGLNGEPMYPCDDLFRMFFPKELFSEEPDTYASYTYTSIPGESSGALRITCDDQVKNGILIELDAIIVPANRLPENMVRVTGFNARSLPEGGTRKFVENLEFQMGQLGYPIVARDASPTDLPYLVGSELSYVPAVLLEGDYASIKEYFAKNRSSQKPFGETMGDYAKVVQYYGKDYSELVSAEVRTQIEEFKKIYHKRLAECNGRLSTTDTRALLAEFSRLFHVRKSA